MQFAVLRRKICTSLVHHSLMDSLLRSKDEHESVHVFIRFTSNETRVKMALWVVY